MSKTIKIAHLPKIRRQQLSKVKRDSCLRLLPATMTSLKSSLQDVSLRSQRRKIKPVCSRAAQPILSPSSLPNQLRLKKKELPIQRKKSSSSEIKEDYSGGFIEDVYDDDFM